MFTCVYPVTFGTIAEEEIPGDLLEADTVDEEIAQVEAKKINKWPIAPDGMSAPCKMSGRKLYLIISYY